MGANVYRNKKPLLFFLVPAFAFMFVFLHYPFVMNILNSFQQIEGLAAPSKGLLDPWYSNYVEMLQDKNMRTALLNTLISVLMRVSDRKLALAAIRKDDQLSLLYFDGKRTEKK